MTCGDTAIFQGPAGRFFVENPSADIAFFVTGTGIAPMFSIIPHLAANKTPSQSISLYWGMKTYSDIYLLKDLIGFSALFPHYSLMICLSREADFTEIPKEFHTYFHLNRIDHFLNNSPDAFLVRPGKTKHYYLCGGRDSVETMRNIVKSRQIHKECVFFEKF